MCDIFLSCFSYYAVFRYALYSASILATRYQRNSAKKRDYPPLKGTIFISVPPSAIQLLDETGAEIFGSVGPFQEDTNLVLTCDILGGETTHL